MVPVHFLGVCTGEYPSGSGLKYAWYIIPFITCGFFDWQMLWDWSKQKAKNGASLWFLICLSCFENINEFLKVQSKSDYLLYSFFSLFCNILASFCFWISRPFANGFSIIRSFHRLPRFLLLTVQLKMLGPQYPITQDPRWLRIIHIITALHICHHTQHMTSRYGSSNARNDSLFFYASK